MNEPIPSPREGLEDKLRAHISRLNDRRVAEHHAIRQLHQRSDSYRCRCCREVWPCQTLRVIDGGAVA
jgi:hypothetical protein